MSVLPISAKSACWHTFVSLHNSMAMHTGSNPHSYMIMASACSMHNT